MRAEAIRCWWAVETQPGGAARVVEIGEMVDRNWRAAMRGEHNGWMTCEICRTIEEARELALELKRAAARNAEVGKGEEGTDGTKRS